MSSIIFHLYCQCGVRECSVTPENSIQRHHDFIAKNLKSRTSPMISSSLKKVARLYARGGFIVRVILMGMDFEKVKNRFEMIEVNTTTARESVLEIEQGICFIKKRTGSAI